MNFDKNKDLREKQIQKYGCKVGNKKICMNDKARIAVNILKFERMLDGQKDRSDY